MRLLVRAIEALSETAGYLAGATVLGLTALIACAVVARRLFGTPILAADELSGYLLLAIVFFGLAYTMKAGGHIRADLVLTHVPGRVRAALDTLATAYAAAGRFDEAARTGRKALELVQAVSPTNAPAVSRRVNLFEQRQRNLLRDDPMFLYCMPPGAVRQFQQPYGIQFFEDKTFGRIFLREGGGNHIWHFIYTDGRPQRGELTGNDDNPLYYGNARGKWEGDTFVVDSKTFNEKFWFSNGGLPHTDLLHLVERFTRSDHNTLKYEVTVDDPGAYTAPWTTGMLISFELEREQFEYVCQDGNLASELMIGSGNRKIDRSSAIVP